METSISVHLLVSTVPPPSILWTGKKKRGAEKTKCGVWGVQIPNTKEWDEQNMGNLSVNVNATVGMPPLPPGCVGLTFPRNCS